MLFQLLQWLIFMGDIGMQNMNKLSVVYAGKVLKDI